MSRANLLCKCTKCRFTHKETDRVQVPLKSIPGMEQSVCPKCQCRSFFDITPSVAWAWSSGLIELGDKVPDSAIKIADGPMVDLKVAIGIAARRGKGDSTGQLLVPGVPEATSQTDKGNALSSWLDWCAKSNGKKHRRGVVFMTEQTGATS